MTDEIIITKIIRPNAFAVPKPFTIFTALTETTKIHTTNAIAVMTNNATYANTGPIMDSTCFSSISDSIIDEGSIDARESIIKNIKIERTTDIGMVGTLA